MRTTTGTANEVVSLKGALPPGQKVYTEREEHTEGRNSAHFVSSGEERESGGGETR